MNILRLAPIGLLVVSAAACTTHATASGSAGGHRSAATASRTPAAKTADVPAGPCGPITKTLTGVDSDAKSQAAAKHAQDPSIAESDLKSNYLVGDLKNAAQALAADAAAPGVTPTLAHAEKDIPVQAAGVYDHIGTGDATPCEEKMQTDLTIAGDYCPGLTQ